MLPLFPARISILAFALSVAACDEPEPEDITEQICVPGDTEVCYSGSSETENVGVCTAGNRSCTEDAQWGNCLGEVVPTAETCLSAEDEDCDGQANESGEGCTCEPGETRECYTAAPLTKGVGICLSGIETCTDEGTGFGQCAGEVTPQVETCATLDDEDCDGAINEDGDLCVCTPDEIQACYTGAAGTEGIGACVGGMATCLSDGTGFGACEGEQIPTPEECDKIDNDCNGATDELPECM